MADHDVESEYRARVKEAERSLVEAALAAVAGRRIDVTLDDPDAPLYRLGDALQALIARLDAVSRERDRLRAAPGVEFEERLRSRRT